MSDDGAFPRDLFPHAPRTPFSDLAKLECAEREVRLRKRVYPGQITAGKMSHAQAEREIDIMEDIARDYRAKIEYGKRSIEDA